MGSRRPQGANGLGLLGRGSEMDRDRVSRAAGRSGTERLREECGVVRVRIRDQSLVDVVVQSSLRLRVRVEERCSQSSRVQVAVPVHYVMMWMKWSREGRSVVLSSSGRPK